MKILDRYIARQVVAATASVLLVLLAIFSFFAFIDELEELGRGAYGLAQVALVVALRLPGLAYELLPIAALIGALLGLGTLAERNEIAVVRAAGVSRARLTRAVMQAGALFVLLAVVLGEWVYPPAERQAQAIRTLAQNDRVSVRSARGFWARDGASFINIGEVLPGDTFKDITILEFDGEQRLRVATAAARARYVDGQWLLEEIEQTHFDEAVPSARRLERAAWNSLLDPELISMIAVNPDTQSLLDLKRYIDFVESNGQSAQRWQHALWVKVGYPFATGVMVFLAIPLVLSAVRTLASGRRVLIGAAIGLAFHVLNQAAGHLGVVFGVPAILSALGPTLVLLAAGLMLHRRTR